MDPQHFRVATDVIESPLEHELILLDASTQEMFSLNPTARLVWQALRRGGVTEALNQVLAKFDVPRERAEADVTALAAEFVKHGLLQPSDDERPHFA